MKELKPCPFCGDNVTITHNDTLNCYFVYHESKNCILEGVSFTGTDAHVSKEEGTKIWNERG